MFGIIGAMEEEVALIKVSLSVTSEREIAGLNFITGNYMGKEVVVVKCGIGKVNAALCTQILISVFEVDCVINTGVAGGLNYKLKQGDIVVSTEVMHHDFDTTPLGEELGHIPGLDSIFKANQDLIDLARASTPTYAYTGRIVSGDVFVASDSLRIKLLRNFDPMCVEMEGSAIGHTCYVNQVPFVVIRSISDKADSDADLSFNEFTKLAAKNSSLTVLAMIETLKEYPNLYPTLN